jgi:division protein CdvB (Snf7/Vps24/ESCRT-III family)
MGVLEDIRQVIQDLVAPQLKSLDARLTALDARVTSLEASINQRFASAEAVANARHDALTAQIAQLANIVATNHAAILQKLDLEKRIERIEMFQAARYEPAPLPPTLEASKL